MERAIRSWQSQMRTLKHYFETMVKRQLPSNCALFSWLVAWTAEVMNKFKVQSNGKTAYEQITKHKCNHWVFGFGESVQWQQTPDKNIRDKFNGDWRDGIFLGVIWRTTEYLIGTADGVYKCNTVKPRPNGSSYDPQCIEYIKIKYGEYVLGGAKSHGARLRFAEPGEPAVPAGSVPIQARGGNKWAPRRMYLPPTYFTAYGYTQGCPGCAYLQHGMGARRGHHDACRTRMEAAIAAADEDRARKHTEKMDQYAAAEGETTIQGGDEQEGEVEV